MQRKRHLGTGFAAAFSCAVATGAVPVGAQSVVAIPEEPYEKPGEIPAPWKLPDEMMEALARRAEEYEQAVPALECRESIRRVKIRPSGRHAEQVTREGTYLLTVEGNSFVPVRLQGRSIRRSRKATAPPAHAWTQLFAAHNQPYIAYRDVGEVPYAFGRARRIQFRGGVPYTDGKDIREWEGTVLVDSFSMLPLEVEARPINLWPRLRHQLDVYNRSFKFVFFGLPIHFKKKPMGERVHVRFDMQSNGLTLPVAARVERIEMVLPDQAAVRSRTVIDYDAYRFPAADPSIP